MGNNTENNRFLTEKNGSGVGSGLRSPSRNQKSFAFRLKSRRDELKITQKELADFVGATKNAYQTWEISTNPSAKYIARLAEKLKCSTDYLLMEKGPEPELPEVEKQIDKPQPLYNKVDSDMGMQVKMPEVAYGAASLKDKLIYSQEKIITHLEKEITDLKARLEVIEKEGVK